MEGQNVSLLLQLSFAPTCPRARAIASTGQRPYRSLITALDPAAPR
jgi:hypothetical protein